MRIIRSSTPSTLNSTSGPSLRYNHPIAWSASFSGGERRVTVKRPSGSHIYFKAEAGSYDASPVGNSRKLDYRVRLLNQDLTPNTQGTPAYMDMVLPSGMILRFSVATGEVVSVTSSSGNTVSAEDYARKVQVTYNQNGSLNSVYSQAQGLMRSIPENNRLTLEWYSPENVSASHDGEFMVIGAPYKTALYETSQEGDVTVTHITNRRAGQEPYFIERREEGNKVTIIKGEGDERIIRTIERNALSESKWERIETVRGINDASPSHSIRTVKKYTDGGWLTISSTEGYNTSTAQTTLYTYNDQYRVSLKIKPDGGYTRYEYDSQGRVVLEATPWAGGGETAIRTQYANLRFNDFRPSMKIELIIEENGTETETFKRIYTYEDTPTVNRTTVTETALGSDHHRISVEEIYGEEAEYSYARGKQKFSQSIDGIQTFSTYEATTEYGAIHKITETVQANGNIIPSQSTLNVEYIAENGTTTRQEQYVHTGVDWSLITSEDYEYDAELRRIKTTKGNGRTSTTEWTCCGPLKETDEDGIVTSYSYNTTKQLVETIRSATETTPEIITSYVRDAAGRILSIRKDIGAMTTVKSTEYDELGRVISKTDILGRITRTTYDQNHLTITETLPSGAILVTKKYYDGTILWEGGTGKREVETRLKLTQEGILTTTLSKGIVLSRTLKDGFNQIIQNDQPNTQGGFITTRNIYNNKGQLVRTQTENMAPTITIYNDFGQVVKQIVLLDKSYPDDTTKNRILESTTYYESLEDGIYQTQTFTTYNAQGYPLSETIQNMVSRVNPILEEKTISTNIYGKHSIQWTKYSAPSKRTQFSKIPTSDIVAMNCVVDGFILHRIDHAGIRSSQMRSYTSTGIILKQIDARNNIITTETDIAGRQIKITDPAGNITTTSYHFYSNSPSHIINAQGNTTYYSYDICGRKTAEYGSAVQPVCFTYDENDRLISLTTFRVNEGDISTDPSKRTDGDITTWIYDIRTGLELKKIYSDGSCISRTYDKLNRLETLTKARGIVTTYQYAPFTGELLAVSHSDDTPSWAYSYNHLGQMTSVCDASGTKELTYDAYGRVQQETSFGTVASCLQEDYDTCGRSCGYRLMQGTHTVQHFHLDYDHKGSIIGMNMEGLSNSFIWEYDETNGFLNQLSYPNGMIRKNTYHPKLNLITSICYINGKDDGTIARHAYEYDALMRPSQRQDSWNVATEASKRNFFYNDRSELIEDRIQQEGSFTYQYDNIGNRKSTQELGENVSYDANELNQYTNIIRKKQDFKPVYDADGNQIRVRTSTGIWDISYDANDRPISFISKDGHTKITCNYDYLGRRFSKKLTINGSTVSHAYYLYRGYLQTAELDMMHPHPLMKNSYLWDPTESMATRILMTTCWEKNGMVVKQHLYNTHDMLKNVTSIFDEECQRKAKYEYNSFGGILIEEEDTAHANKFRFSCEYIDDELGLIYYNYRHLNPLDGRWITRDPKEEAAGLNLNRFNLNTPTMYVDVLGLNEVILCGGCNSNTRGLDHDNFPGVPSLIKALAEKLGLDMGGTHDRNWSNFITAAEKEIKRRKKVLKKGEKIEWIVDIDSYRTRAINDGKNPNHYTDIIAKKAKELDVILKFYWGRIDLRAAINSMGPTIYHLSKDKVVTFQYEPRSGDAKISRFVYFGHGSPGNLMLRFIPHNDAVKPPPLLITNDDIKKGFFNRDSFIKGAVAISCGCNSATPPSDGKQSFTEVWEEYFGFIMSGVKGKTNYESIETEEVPKPSEGASWVPVSPGHPLLSH